LETPAIKRGNICHVCREPIPTIDTNCSECLTITQSEDIWKSPWSYAIAVLVGLAIGSVIPLP